MLYNLSACYIFTIEIRDNIDDSNNNWENMYFGEYLFTPNMNGCCEPKPYV